MCNIYIEQRARFSYFLTVLIFTMNALRELPITMPDLQVTSALDSDDEDGDADEEKNLMGILMKLKAAKTNIEESRKR